MSAKNAKPESDGFSAAERAAMKKRAAELRAEGKKGAKKADGLQAVLDSIAEMAPEDRMLRACRKITRSFLECVMPLWYGRQRGSSAGSGGEVRGDLPASG
jgi:anti-sigma factor RsiW